MQLFRTVIARGVLGAQAALCAAVGFADIESANVVGYYTYDLEAGYNFVTPVFENVGGGEMSIQDVKILGSEGWSTEYIYGLDSDGLLTDQNYSWQCGDNTGLDHFAWIDEMTGEEADYTFTPGTGFYLYADSEGLKLQTCGQVTVGGYSRELDMGYNFTGNFSPVDLDLQEITLEGSEGWSTEYIYGLDADGLLTDQNYSWQCGDNTGLDHFAWIDEATGEEAEGVTIKAGQALYIYADSEGLVLKLPAVLQAPVVE